LSHDEVLAAAHDYRKRGWRVIALHHITETGGCSCRQGALCSSAGKHPVDMKWQDTAPLSAADVQALFDVEGIPPNIGLAVGAASGFWVLDIDPDGGGFESMKALVDEHGRLPDTRVHVTGSGGYHYLFSLPEFELRNSQGRIARGIDTRATGGQVVAPPSVSAKGDYTVVCDLPIAPAPEWLLQLARKTEADPASIVTAVDLPKPEDIEPAEWERLNRYTAATVEKEREKLRQLGIQGWSGAPWNATTHAVACNLIEFANSPWNSYSLGHAEQDVKTLTPRDKAGFDDYVVNKTWESARDTVGNKARPMPDKPAPRDPGGLFGGADVRRSSDPTEGGGAQPDPSAGGDWGWLRFYHGKDLLVDELAAAVMEEGPIAWGRDEAFWSFQDGVWVPDPFVVEARCVRLLGPTYRNGHAANTATVVRHSVMYLSGDPVPRWINFQNGMLDWASGDLIGHDPNLKSTVQMGVAYDATAECPTFDAFLADVMHPDYVDLAWEMLGYLMYSGNPFQVAFMFYGSGGNGKGTLMRVITALLGKQNIASESLDDLNGNRFSAVNLFGRIANLAGDIDGTYQESTANFKKLTGEDTYAGERKFGQRFNFESWAVPVFSANKIPGSADVTEGYLRRWIILHFGKRIQNMIPGFSDLLAAELPGIARKAVQRLPMLMAAKGFNIHGEALKGKEDFAQAIDQVRQWVASGDAISSPGQWTPLQTLYNAYGQWADRSGQRRVREQEFSHRLEAIGIPMAREEGVISHQGLTVAPMNFLVAPNPSNY
jgi:putative DNA primase/helicase